MGRTVIRPELGTTSRSVKGGGTLAVLQVSLDLIQMALVARNHERLSGQISKAKEIFKLKRV